MNQVVADLEKLVTDLKAAVTQLTADGKVVEAAVLNVINAQFEAALTEIRKLSFWKEL